MAADEVGGPPGPPPDFLTEPPDPPPAVPRGTGAPPGPLAGPRRFPWTWVGEVSPKKVGWLWKPWLPHGLAWLEGDQGTNKSMLAVLLSATVTRGAPFPGEEEWRPPANVLYLSSGEDPDSVIRERFERAEGDLNRLALLDTQKLFADQAPGAPGGLPSFPRDTSGVFAIAEEIEAKLLVLDAAFSFLSGEDVFNDQAFRAAIEPFARGLAARGITALCIRHFTKMKQKAQHQGMGAVAGAAVARAVLMMNEDSPISRGGTGDPDVRLLSCTKQSYGPKPVGSMMFKVQSQEGEDPWETAAWLTYIGESKVSATNAAKNRGEDHAADVLGKDLEEAFKAAFLEGPIPVSGLDEGGSPVQRSIEGIAKTAGWAGENFPNSRIGRRVKAALGAKAVQAPGIAHKWFWALEVTTESGNGTSPGGSSVHALIHSSTSERLTEGVGIGPPTTPSSPSPVSRTHSLPFTRSPFALETKDTKDPE